MEIKTPEQIKEFLKKEKISIPSGNAYAEAVFELLSEKLKSFDPKDQTKILDLDFILEKELMITDKKQIDKLLVFLVGKDMKSLIAGLEQHKENGEHEDDEELDTPVTPPKGKDGEALDAEFEVLEPKKKFNFVDFAIDSYSTKKAKLERKSMDSYEKGKGSQAKDIGRAIVGYGLTTAKVATVGTVVATLKLAKVSIKYGVKAFKAVKGKLAEVMNRKAQKDLGRAQLKVLETDERLHQMSAENIDELQTLSGALDEKSNATQILDILRDENGDENKLQELISEGYIDASSKRDNALAEFVNHDVIEVLTDRFGLSKEEAFTYLASVGEDKEGNLEFPEDERVDGDTLKVYLESKGMLEEFKFAKESQYRIDTISEQDKSRLFDYIDIQMDEVTGEKVVKIKPGVDLDSLSYGLKQLLTTMDGRCDVDDNLAIAQAENQRIDFYVGSAAGLMTKMAIRSNVEIGKKVSQRMQDLRLSDSRKFVKQAGNMIKGLDIRGKAERVVHDSIEKSIFSTIRSHGDKMEGLLDIAKGRLLGEEEHTIDTDRTIEERTGGDGHGEK